MINPHDIEDFPALTEDDLRDITMGVYQLRVAKSYIAENFNQEVTRVCYYRVRPNLLRFKIQSRHKSNKEY